MNARRALAGGLAAALLASALAARQGLGPGPGRPQEVAHPPRSAAPAAGSASSVDAAFARNMLVHHDQAITLARLALDRASPPVRALAQGMLEKQLLEIGWFQGWLAAWGLPVDGDADMRWMEPALRRSGLQDLELERLLAVCRDKGMPGLVAAGDLDALPALRGRAFDQRFLALMAAHHQGALAMAQFAADLAESGHVRNVARSTRFEQAAEIARMQQMSLALAAQDEKDHRARRAR